MWACVHTTCLLVLPFYVYYIYIYLSWLQKLHTVFFITPSVSTTSVARLLVDDDDDDDDGCQKYVQ